VRQLTRTGVHVGAVISPDGRSVYQLRSSGRVLGDSLETPGLIEHLDLSSGAITPVASLPEIVDLSLSADGHRLAAAHAMGSPAERGLDANGITVIDLTQRIAPAPVPRTFAADNALFSAVTEVALDPDGTRVAYALAQEIRRNTVVNTLHIQDLAPDTDTDTDTVVYTAEGTDFVSDVEWSPDGTAVLAAVRYQAAGDALEAPPRFRTVRVDGTTGATTISEGFAQDFSPISTDGSRLLGLAPAPGGEASLRGRALVSWDIGSRPASRLPVEGGATGIAVASCSFR
jgi:hypothetical protein